MGSAVSVEQLKLFSDDSNWSVSHEALDQYLNVTRKKAKRALPEAYFGEQVRLHFVKCVRAVVHDALIKAQPDEHVLSVAFAEVVNNLCLYCIAEGV